MAVSHVKSNTAANMTGTVTVFNSAGVTTTAAATDLMRPLDWNSAHNQFITLGGNTLGASTLSGTNIEIHGAGNVSVSGTNGTLVIAANAQTVQTQNMVSVQGSTGAISFGNGNGLTFGGNASTITASHNGLTSQSNQAYSAGNGSAAFQTITFADSNGVSFSTGTQGLYATVKTDYLTTAALSNHSHGNPTLALTNLSGTTASNSAGLTLSLSAAAAGGGNFSAGISGGNTSGDTGTVSNQIVFAGGNNITVSGSTNAGGMSVTISGANAGGAQTGISGIVVSNTTYTSGTVSFSNANGISFGSSAGQAITASYTVPTVTNSSWTVSDNGTSGSVARLAFTNLNGVTLSLSTGAGGSHTIVGSHNALTSQSNQAVSGSNGSFTFQTVTFGNLNGLSFYTSNGSVVGSHNALTTAAASDHSHGNPTLALTNLSGTTASNSAGLTLSLSAAAPGGAASVTMYATGNTTQSSTGTQALSSMVVQGTGGVSAGISNGSIVISGPALTSLSATGALSASSNGSTISLGVGTVTVSATSNTTQASSGTLNLNALIFNGAGIASVGVSNGSMVVSATQSNQAFSAGAASSTFQTLSFQDSNGVSFSNNAGAIRVTHALAGTATTFNGTNVSGSMTLNSAGLRLDLSAGAGGGVNPVASASNGSFSFTTLAFSNANNVTFGTSAGSIITASVAAPGAAAEQNAMNLLGANTAGNTTATGSTIGLSGLNLTLSGTNASQIVISAPATSSLVGQYGVQISTNGSTITVQRQLGGYYAYPIPAMVNTQTLAPQSNTSYVFPIEIKEAEAVAFGRGPQTVSISSMASIATTANTTFSYNQQGTFNVVMYTRGTGASSLSLQSVFSTSYSSRGSINVQANANGSQWSVTHAYSFPASNTDQATLSFSYATTLTNINISTTHLTAMTGAKIVAGPLSTTLAPAQYWMAFGNQTAQTTNGAASLSNMRSTASYLAMSQVNLTWAEFGSATASSIQNNFGLGSYTKAATGTTDSIGLSQISSASSHLVPYFTFVRIA